MNTMKTLKIAGLFIFVMVIFSSCFLHFGVDPPENVEYQLSLSFQDAFCRDLVKGIGLEWWPDSTIISEEQAQSGIVRDSLYTLDIIVSEPCKNWDNKIYNVKGRPDFIPAINRPGLSMYKYIDGYCYLSNGFSVPVNDCPEERILTYQLKCPYLFGDEAIHEFVTYWDIPKAKKLNQHTAKCYRIEFEGNEIIPQLSTDINENGDYMAIIKLK